MDAKLMEFIELFRNFHFTLFLLMKFKKFFHTTSKDREKFVGDDFWIKEIFEEIFFRIFSNKKYFFYLL